MMNGWDVRAETQKRNDEGLEWGGERCRNKMMKGWNGQVRELVLFVNIK